jgi:hypothetical protein
MSASVKANEIPKPKKKCKSIANYQPLSSHRSAYLHHLTGCSMANWRIVFSSAFHCRLLCISVLIRFVQCGRYVVSMASYSGNYITRRHREMMWQTISRRSLFSEDLHDRQSRRFVKLPVMYKLPSYKFSSAMSDDPIRPPSRISVKRAVQNLSESMNDATQIEWTHLLRADTR